jgi:hypothetical protein
MGDMQNKILRINLEYTWDPSQTTLFPFDPNNPKQLQK